MKIGIVIGTDEAETVWNAFRFGNTSLQAGHEVNVFLINKGVEVEDIEHDKYDVDEQTDLFLENGGDILACGTCLQSRKKDGSEVCPISTMEELLELVEKSDRVLTFS